MIYVLCVKKTRRKILLRKKPKFISLAKPIDPCKERNKNNDSKTVELFERLKNVTAAELLEKKLTYHFDCYKDIINPKTTERIKRRYNDAKKKNNNNC